MRPGCRSVILSISSVSLCPPLEDCLLSPHLLLGLLVVVIGNSFSDNMPPRMISIAGALMPLSLASGSFLFIIFYKLFSPIKLISFFLFLLIPPRCHFSFHSPKFISNLLFLSTQTNLQGKGLKDLFDKILQ
jgi:hypothetical protein